MIKKKHDTRLFSTLFLFLIKWNPKSMYMKGPSVNDLQTISKFNVFDERFENYCSDKEQESVCTKKNMHYSFNSFLLHFLIRMHWRYLLLLASTSLQKNCKKIKIISFPLINSRNL